MWSNQLGKNILTASQFAKCPALHEIPGVNTCTFYTKLHKYYTLMLNSITKMALLCCLHEG